MEPMEDLPMNPVLYRREVDRLERELSKERAKNASKPRKSTLGPSEPKKGGPPINPNAPLNLPKRKTTTHKRTTVKKTAQPASRPKKSLPAYRLPGEQPRDSLGRFARKTGAVLWAGTKAAGRAIAGTVKTVRKAHKKVNRVRAAGRRRANLEARERRIALAEREKKLGVRKKVRRRKR